MSGLWCAPSEEAKPARESAYCGNPNRHYHCGCRPSDSPKSAEQHAGLSGKRFGILTDKHGNGYARRNFHHIDFRRKTPGRTIELTVPADFLDEGTTQESLDAEVSKADGFISAKINADGSATYVMTESKHNDLMQELRQNIDTELAKMADSSDYPNIVSVSASNDYTAFTVTLSTDTVGLQESIMVMAFYMYGGMYNAFNGTPADNVSVQFVNQSGTVLESANSRDMQ